MKVWGKGIANGGALGVLADWGGAHLWRRAWPAGDIDMIDAFLSPAYCVGCLPYPRGRCGHDHDQRGGWTARVSLPSLPVLVPAGRLERGRHAPPVPNPRRATRGGGCFQDKDDKHDFEKKKKGVE